VKELEKNLETINKILDYQPGKVVLIPSDYKKVLDKEKNDIIEKLPHLLTLVDIVEVGDLNYLQAALKKKDVDINKEKDGISPLKMAILADDLEKAEVLLKAGANPNEQGLMHISLLTQNPDYKMVTLLIRYGADPSIAEKFAKKGMLKNNFAKAIQAGIDARNKNLERKEEKKQ